MSNLATNLVNSFVFVFFQTTQSGFKKRYFLDTKTSL